MPSETDSENSLSLAAFEEQYFSIEPLPLVEVRLQSESPVLQDILLGNVLDGVHEQGKLRLEIQDVSLGEAVTKEQVLLWFQARIVIRRRMRAQRRIPRGAPF